MNTEEYISLREEILQCGTNSINTMGFVIAAVGAFVTAAFGFNTPIAALVPLLILYLGLRILENSAQTTARNSTYIRVFWESRSPDFQWETRLSKHRESVDQSWTESRRKRIARLQPSPLVYERWMAPLAQRVFLFCGFACIGVFVWLSVFQWLNAGANLQLHTLTDWAGLIAFVTLLAFSLLSWLLISLRTQRLGRVIYGDSCMMEEMIEIWTKVRDQDPNSKSPTQRSQNERPDHS